MSLPSISYAITLFYKSADCKGYFGLYDLVDFVRVACAIHCTDATVSRKMRHLKSEGFINYRIEDSRRGLYEFRSIENGI